MPTTIDIPKPAPVAAAAHQKPADATDTNYALNGDRPASEPPEATVATPADEPQPQPTPAPTQQSSQAPAAWRVPIEPGLPFGLVMSGADALNHPNHVSCRTTFFRPGKSLPDPVEEIHDLIRTNLSARLQDEPKWQGYCRVKADHASLDKQLAASKARGEYLVAKRLTLETERPSNVAKALVEIDHEIRENKADQADISRQLGALQPVWESAQADATKLAGAKVNLSGGEVRAAFDDERGRLLAELAKRAGPLLDQLCRAHMACMAADDSTHWRTVANQVLARA